MKRTGTFWYRSEYRRLTKAIDKAIRHHKKRSHLKRAKWDLYYEWCAYAGITLTTIISKTFKRREKKLVAAISDKNPLLEMLRKKGAASLATAGRTINQEIKRSKK